MFAATIILFVVICLGWLLLLGMKIRDRVGMSSPVHEAKPEIQPPAEIDDPWHAVGELLTAAGVQLDIPGCMETSLAGNITGPELADPIPSAEPGFEGQFWMHSKNIAVRGVYRDSGNGDGKFKFVPVSLHFFDEGWLDGKSRENLP